MKPKFVLNYHIRDEVTVKKVENALLSLIDNKNLIEVKTIVKNAKNAFDFCVNTLKIELKNSGLQEAQIVYEKKQCFEWSDKAVALKKTKAFIHKNIVIDKTKQLESFAENLESILEQSDSDRVAALSKKKIQLKIQENDE